MTKAIKKGGHIVVYSDNSELKIAKENNENDNNDKISLFIFQFVKMIKSIFF